MTMEDFAAELENKWYKLEQEKLQNDMENYAIDVHSLKSDCKYLGFYDLADVAYEHELKSKENDSQFVNDNFERLTNEYEKVLNTVNEYKDRHKQSVFFKNKKIVDKKKKNNYYEIKKSCQIV